MSTKQTTIVRKLILYVVLFSSILTLVITSFQLFRDYKSDVNLIQISFKQVETSYLDSIRASLWNFDKQQLETILRGIRSLRDIEHVEIVTEDQKRISVGNNQGEDQLNWQTKIEYNYKNDNILLGTLYVSASLNEVYARLWDKVWIILVSNAIKTFSVSFFIFLIFQHMITRHLLSMTNFTQNISQKEKPNTLFLNRRKSENSKNDELDMLSRALNEMAENTYFAYSELKEREERFRSLAEHIHEVFWIVSPDWQEVIYISPTYESVWGKSCESLYQSPLSWFDSIVADDQSKVQDHIDERSKKDAYQSSIFPEFRIKRDDGKVLTILAKAFPIVDENQNVLRVAGIAEDVTELRNNEELLRRTQKLDALGQLTGGIAHDYNNMLGVIIGYSEILLSTGVLEGKSKNYAEEIYHAAKRGANLTDKLLGFSRHKPSLTTNVKINKILEKSQIMLEKTLTVRINIHMSLGNDVWCINVDESALEDSLLNICINAMHAMPDGGDLTITTRNVKLGNDRAEALGLVEGEYVVLSIADTGIGMDTDTQMKIFDPFFTTKEDKGTGLGLSQVYGFMLRSSGMIKVNSAVNEGSSFDLYFPRCIDQSIIELEKREADTPSINVENEIRILVIDDEPGLLNLATDILSSQGYLVEGASQADQALEILKEKPINVVLTDVVMPGMSGIELADYIKKHYPHIKIQLVSGYTDKEKQFNSGIQDILYKPYKTQHLLAKIKNLTDTIDIN